MGKAWRAGLLIGCCILLATAGCTRTKYRRAADAESYCILEEKTACTPWQPPSDYTIQPDPRSRFCDPTCPDDPALPTPSPRLYAYDLPPLPERDPLRFRQPDHSRSVSPRRTSESRRDSATIDSATIDSPTHPDLHALMTPLVDQASYQEPVPSPALTAPDTDTEPELLPPEADRPTSSSPQLDIFLADASASELRIVPIPASAWQSLPESCLVRMFEFESVREEYDRTFRHEPDATRRDQDERLSLEDVVELALINSREYQLRKEALYEAALALSLERYAYAVKFSSSGNGTDPNYRHNRTGGITEDTLSVPSALSSDMLLATGGTVLANFANSVVLTFNGPDGFAADVGSELLFDISQSLCQRDIVLESLTQAERDVVYAARDYARFRKLFFRDLAAQYYNLLLTFREIEIAAQNYFSNVRGFNQGEAEYRAGRIERFQVDQFEQDSLTSRNGLIGRCNRLEQALDELKLSMGLPPEMPINLDLTELEELTLRDEMQVSTERVRRSRRNLLSERREQVPEQRMLINGAIQLARRMRRVMELRQSLGQQQGDMASLQGMLGRLSVAEVRRLVRLNRANLLRETRDTEVPSPVRIFQRTLNLVDSLLMLVERDIALAQLEADGNSSFEPLRAELDRLKAEYDRVRVGLETVVKQQRLDRIPTLVDQANTLLAASDALATRADALGTNARQTPAQELDETLRQVDRLLAESKRMLAQETGGLVPVEIGMDDAMLTALVERFDLMNERGNLADTWRRVKLAGDDLKSVLNLRATQLIGTEHNRPFGFTFDESETRLALSFDAPLNRKAQRNIYRRSLINYQTALRNLMEMEDGIKATIRDDLRELQLDREQYSIAVASAALAYDRVISTRLQLQLGIGSVAARDVLEAQRDFTASLNAVARAHITYVLNRINLFVDLERLEVDEQGFWPELYNESYQPTPSYQLPCYARPAYGTLPPGLCHSKAIKRMLKVPTGCSEIFKGPVDSATIEDEPEQPPEEIPTPEPEQ